MPEQSSTPAHEIQQLAENEQHLKALAVRIDERLHAELRFIAQLSSTNVSEEIRTAIEQRIASAQNDPDLLARAEQAHQQIEREAAARSAAIAGFIGKPTTQAATKTAAAKSTRPRRSGPGSNASSDTGSKAE